ncbi:hypothetical protein JCM1841_001746 [Sporobolomyces salmonicolor]
MGPTTPSDSNPSDPQSLFLHYAGLRDSHNHDQTLSEPQNLEIAAGQSYAAALLEIRTELDLPESLFKCALLRTHNGNKFRVAPSAWRFLKPGDDLELEVVRKAIHDEEKPKHQHSESTGKASPRRPSRPSRPFSYPISHRSLPTSAAGRHPPTSNRQEDCVVPATPSNSDRSETEGGNDEPDGGLGERRGGAQRETGGKGKARETTTPVEMLDHQVHFGQPSGGPSTSALTSARALSGRSCSPSADMHGPAKPAQSLAKAPTALQPPCTSAQHQAHPELLPTSNLASFDPPPASFPFRDFLSCHSQFPPTLAPDQSAFSFSNTQDHVRDCRSPSPSPSCHSERSLVYKQQMQRRTAEHLTVASAPIATLPAVEPSPPVPQVELSSLQPKPLSSGPRSSQTSAESDISLCVGVDASGQIGFVPRSPENFRQRQAAVVEQGEEMAAAPRADKGKRRAGDDSSSDDEIVVVSPRRLEYSSSDDEILAQGLVEPSPHEQHSSALFSSSLSKPSPGQPSGSTSIGSLHPIASASAQPYTLMSSSLRPAPIATTSTSALATKKRPASASRLTPRKRARISVAPVPPATGPARTSVAPAPPPTGPAPPLGRSASQATLPVALPPPNSPRASRPSTAVPTTTSRTTPAKDPRAPRPSLKASQRQALVRDRALAKPRATPPAFPRSGRFCLYLRLPNWPIGPKWADTGLRPKFILTFGAQGPNGDQTLGLTLARVFEFVAKETGWAVKDLRLRYVVVQGDDDDDEEEHAAEKCVYGFDEIFTGWRDLEEWGVTDNALLDVDFVPYDPLRPWNATL